MCYSVVDNLLISVIHHPVTTPAQPATASADHFGRSLRALLDKRELSYEAAGRTCELHSRTLARWASLQQFDGEPRNLIRLLRSLNNLQPLSAAERRAFVPALGPALSQIDEPTDNQRLMQAIASIGTMEALARLIRRYGEETVRGILIGLEVSADVLAPKLTDAGSSAPQHHSAPAEIKPPPGAVAHHVDHNTHRVTVIEPVEPSKPKATAKRRTSN